MSLYVPAIVTDLQYRHSSCIITTTKNKKPLLDCAMIQSQRCHDTFWTLANLPDECVHNCVAIFAGHLDHHDEAGSPLHQRGDVAFFGTAQQISFPMPWHGVIFNLGRPV